MAIKQVFTKLESVLDDVTNMVTHEILNNN